jgi:hypothetical protein
VFSCVGRVVQTPLTMLSVLGVAEWHHRSTIAVLKPSCAARIAVT